MKYLKIKDNKGLFWDGKEYQDIDKINKDDLLRLLNSAEVDDFEIDIYNENSLGNKAHQIIYENIYNKLQQFLGDKNHFKTEVDRLYIEAMNKYSVKTIVEDVDGSEGLGNEENKFKEVKKEVKFKEDVEEEIAEDNEEEEDNLPF